MNKNLTPIASAVALLVMAAAAMPVYAQQADDTAPKADSKSTDKSGQIEQVTISGIRGSLQKSLTQKRNADSHVEVITAEDIGKMPDKNVADSLSRVPGVTIGNAGATEGGFDEADRVSMRGTSPSLTQTLINGHNVASGDWFVLDQSGQVGRSVSYTMLPSELVGSVVVHKSSEASLVEGGVAGSVDIITRKPLEFKKQFTAEATLGAVYADLPGKTDPQISALINWKNEANTFGILVQAFSEERHLERQGQEILGYTQIAPGSKIATAHPDLAGVYAPNLINSALFEQQRKRTGGLIDAQFKVSNDFSFDINGFTSEMKAANYNRSYEFWGAQVINAGAGQSPNPGYTVKNNTLTSATFAPVAGTNYGVYDQISRPDESASSNFVEIGTKWRASDSLNFTTKLGTSTGEGKTPTQNVAEWNVGVGAGAGYQLNGIGTAANWNLGATNNSSPNTGTTAFGWIFGDQNVDVKDKENWAQIDGEYTAGWGALSSVQFGARYNDHKRSSDGVIGQGPTADASNPANFPQGYQNFPSNFGSGLGSGFPTNVWYYTPGQLAAFNAFTNRDPVSREDWNSEFSVKEKNAAGYLQGNLEGNHWSGNVGVRVVQTQENVLSNVAAPATAPGAITTSAFGPFVRQQDNNTYVDVLPSANLKFELSKDVIARFALSKTMTRPDYSALAGQVSLSPPAQFGSIGSGSGGNPNLKPITSNNFDTSIEWYFAPRSLVSASVFNMNLTSYVGLGSVTRSYVTSTPDHPANYMADYVLTVPVNTSGTVTGVELAYEMPLGKYFGFATNATFINAYDANNGPLVGASKRTANLTAYFEDERFNARISYNYRSAFYSGLDRSTAFYQAGVGTLAMSLGFKYSEQLAFTLDAQNLNNPTLKYYALSEDQPRAFYKNGRQFYLNAHLKF
ncbi:N-acetylglucosamine-regulated TonB-dependent outer membrane receptor [Collimonas arenae]|uniref:N-acetylglucosamine-regulated TonB-dependent outer membrane receptor n=1 Tax=Collimonas arenae TaxID=279058 RepID=A0A0A1FD43_9BURK|nr:TonB-dependent receptor [Collimonas arenae]AIY40732.1 N-acetylglucosamine-regulated TonB-dependent outer membrane receptor [Collimonas arenae]